MAEYDDDLPPPLQSLPDQVQALQVKDSSEEVYVGGELRIATTTIVDQPASKPKPSIKKGFFDAKPKASPKPKAAATAAPVVNDDVEEITVIRSKKDNLGSGLRIPEFLKVEPSEEEKKLHQLKSELVSALKPTPDMINQVSQNTDLMTGFDDPEVMAAVSDVASNPQNIKKYQTNQKVMKFYAAMGQMMGEKLEKMPNKPLYS